MNPIEHKSPEETIAESRSMAMEHLASRDQCDGFDRGAWDLCAQQGVLGAPLPTSWQGREFNTLESVKIFQALGHGGADRGLLFAMGAHLFGCALPVARFGNEQQQDQWGTALATGKVVAALSATEPTGGSSTSKMNTLARLDGPEGSDYLITGEKSLITNALDADVFLVITSEMPKMGSMGLTAFLIPRQTPGLNVTPMDTALGMNGAPVGHIKFDGCRVPASSVLGKPRGGWAVFLAAMQYERTCLLAGFIGAAQRDLEACVSYACNRGDNVFKHQSVSHRLARCKCRIESARAMLHRGAQAIDLKEDALLWPAMVKMTVSEALVDCAMDVLTIYAGAGWLDQDGSATALRDVVGTLSASGTSNMQLELIASYLKQPSG
jgi:alkylation response protein AidB-like acyl-CoA dehydrogenase